MNAHKDEAWSGLVFDLGDVLYDTTAWRRWLLQLLARMGLHTNYRSFFRLWDGDYYELACRGVATHDEALRSLLTAVGLTRGQASEALAASQHRWRQWEAQARPLPGVQRTIRELSARGFSLAVLANSHRTSEQLAAQLEHSGLARCFTAILSSRELGATKPAPAAYQAAIDRLELAPTMIAYVGDDARSLAGARACGLATVAVNHEGPSLADLSLDHFEQLLALLPSENRQRLAGGAAA